MGRRQASSGRKRPPANPGGARGGLQAPDHIRAWRHHGGPPAHIVQRQQSAQARHAQRRAERAVVRTQPLPNVLPPPSIAAATVERAIGHAAHAIAVVEAPRAETLSTNSAVASADVAAAPADIVRLERREAERATRPVRRWITPERVAAALILLPVVSIGALIAAGPLSRSTTRPAVAPSVIATIETKERAMLERQAAAVSRTIATLPAPVLLAPPRVPALGELGLGPLQLPKSAPEVEVAAKIEAENLTPPLAWPPIAALPPLTLPAEQEVAVVPPAPVAVAPQPEPRLAERTLPERNETCTADRHFTLAMNRGPLGEATSDAAEGFATRLVAAAKADVGAFAYYNARYTRIAFPMGDVSAFYGVCTDVVVRAYRRLGIDLQAAIATARVGTGDASIDHRRTEVMRRFLALAGETLKITDFAEDYLPGDIVTYYRPQNSSSTAHIAIVSDVMAPSGRPMIVHNRGFGVQLEDALFVDKITGHYRYAPATAPVALALRGSPRPVRSPAAARLAQRVGASAQPPTPASNPEAMPAVKPLPTQKSSAPRAGITRSLPSFAERSTPVIHR